MSQEFHKYFNLVIFLLNIIVFVKLYSSEGRFSFTTHMPGEHVICLYSNSTAWFGGGNLRVHLDIEVGEHAVDYNELAGKEKLTELQLRVRQLLDQVEQISKEQNYQRVIFIYLNNTIFKRHKFN